MAERAAIQLNDKAITPPTPNVKTAELNAVSVEMIESPVLAKLSNEDEAECKVAIQQTIAAGSEPISEDIVCEKFTNQMKIKVEPSTDAESRATVTPTEPMDVDAALIPPLPIEPALPPQQPPSPPPPPPAPIEETIDVKPAIGSISCAFQRNEIAAASPVIKIKSEIKEKQIDEKPQKAIDSAGNLPKETNEEIEDPSIRRSGRIRTINKTKQRAQGFGLVKDKKRASFVVDEDSSSFDMSTDNIQEKDASQSMVESKPRIKSEEQLEKERVDRENGMKLFQQIIDNEYRSERTISKEAKKMTCDCFLTRSEIERGEMGCGDDCLNRMLLIECGPKCVVGDRCTNRRFQKHQNSSCNIFKTEKKGYGLIATDFIPAGQFIMEYVGEVLNSKQFDKRANDYSKLMNAHYYFMALSSDCVIDATKKGNISRFINHSCDPNAETQKWTVNGELRIGFFSKKPILPDDEITFDYQFQRYGYETDSFLLILVIFFFQSEHNDFD